MFDPVEGEPESGELARELGFELAAVSIEPDVPPPLEVLASPLCGPDVVVSFPIPFAFAERESVL